jgi:hypothetical protein
MNIAFAKTPLAGNESKSVNVVTVSGLLITLLKAIVFEKQFAVYFAAYNS